MIIHLSKFRRLISIYFLTIFLCFIWGTEAYGRPGGPAQPEFTSFTPIGSSEMVDKFSGGFAYNIPLFDIGGYPVNIAYDGSVSNDVDASWVGLGWNLNTGSINRSKRGIPDDFKGSKITRSMKKDEVYRLGISPGGHIQILNALGFSLKGGLYYSSLTGYGTEASFGKSLGFPIKVSGKMTIGPSIGENTSSSSDGGVTNSFNVGMNVGTSFDMSNNKTAGLNLGLSYGESTNSRQGLMQTGFNASLSGKLTKKQTKEVTEDANGKQTAYDGAGKTDEEKAKDNVKKIDVPRTLAAGKLGGIGFTKSFIDPTFMPTIEIPYNNKSYSLNLKVGLHGTTIDGGGTLDGYATFQNLSVNNMVSKGYGFLYSENALADPDRLMDFNREKDVPFHVKVPNIAIPQMTYDLFTINQHQNGGQFRAYRNDVGLIKDQTVTTTNDDYNLGLEAHFSAILELGATIDVVNSETKTIPFIEDALKPYDFCPNIAVKNPLRESFVFRKTSEVESPDNTFYSKINQLSATNLQLDNDGNRNGILESKTGSFLNNLGLQRYYTQDNSKIGDRFYRPNIRNTYISALSIENKELYSADKKIISFSMSDYDPYLKTEDVTSSTIGSIEDKNLISEFTVVNPDGSKYHYGVPVMNKKQDEYSFSIPKTTPFLKGGQYTGLVSYNAGALAGNLGNTYDGYYCKESTPTYAHAWLLSGIYSPDYQDITSNGITEDDRGNAIKFNYTKKGDYKWRNPVNPDKSAGALTNLAIHNKGIEYIEDDDKAIVNYGEREEWYNHSIESKATLAIFRTSTREDARPMNLDGSVITNSGKEKLDEIRLYSKFEIEILKNQYPGLTRDQLLTYATPIKTVKFLYNYSLCPKTPNSTADGKLTLTEIHITGGKNSTAYKYKFDYGPNNNIHNPEYNAKNIDRWGNNKPANDNSTYFGSAPNLTNDAFPYTIQHKDLKTNIGNNIGNNANDRNAQAWLLKTVTLPSGGTIDVNYESHDYSYVQNKRTSKMFKLVGIGNKETDILGLTKLYNGTKSNNFLFFETDYTTGNLTTTEIKELFFKDINDYGSDKYIFYKTRIKMPNNKVENIPGWVEVKPNSYGQHINKSSNGKVVVWVEIKSIPYTIKTTIPMFGGALNKDLLKVELSPIARNSWQFIRDYIPELAWDGYTLGKNPDPFDVITSLLGNIGKIFAGERQFEVQCIDRGLAQDIVLDGASFVRAYIPTKTKFGGSGSRVRRIAIRDNWADLTGITDPNLKPENAIYTYDYEYTTKDINGNDISSGVASYEPLIGGEENSWRQPVFYEGQMGPGGPTSMNSIEKPFGESMFPNPHVGYSVVKVVANKDKAETLKTGNGHKEYEFYTAKDFPVQTENTELNDRTIKRNKNSIVFDILGFGGNKFDRTSVSQGYSIILNDMHGKPKGEKTYKYGNNAIPLSYTKFYYKNTTELPVITDNNQIINKNVGVQSDFFVDARFQISTTSQKNFTPGGGIEPPPAPVPIFWFTFFAMFNSDEKSVKMISTNKVTSKSFPKYKTEINTDGALVTTEDLLWDDKTGHIVLSKMSNEFKDKTVYNLNMPAYWNYKNLGHIYHTQDAEFDATALAPLVTNCASDICIQKNGVVHNKVNYLQDGDEIFLERKIGTDPKFYPVGKYNFIKGIKDISLSPSPEIDLLVTENGSSFIPGATDAAYKIKILRSVNKNQMSAPGLSVVSNESPINTSGTALKSSVNKVLNAQSTEYLDDWRNIVKNKDIVNSTTGDALIQYQKNAIVSGIKGDIKPYRAYGVIGNRTGFTNTNEEPNVANDDVMTNNPMTGGDVLQIPYNFNSGFNTIGWDYASETSLYDSKGNLVEDKIRMCKYGYCLGTPPPPPPAAPPALSAPQNKSNAKALGFVTESEVKSESKIYKESTEIDNGKTIVTKIKDSFPLDSNYLSYGKVNKTNSKQDDYDRHVLPANYKELSLEEKREYLPKEILDNPYYKLAEKEARLIERGEENVDKIIKSELTKIIDEKYEEYLGCEHTECAHVDKKSKPNFKEESIKIFGMMENVHKSAANEIYHSEDVITTSPCSGGNFENNGQPFSTYTADWHGRYSHANSKSLNGVCNDDNKDKSIYTYDPTLDVDDNADSMRFSSCSSVSSTRKHYKIVPRGNDPILGSLLMTTRSVGNNYSLKLGNALIEGHAESISKRFIITEENRFVSFWYAFVIQTPGEGSCDDPIFGVRIYDDNSNDPVPYSSAPINISGSSTSYVNLSTASPSLFGQFNPNPSCKYPDGTDMNIYYSNWRCGFVDLTQWLGDTISLEFYTKDCKRDGHFGYAYIDDISCSSFDCHNKGDVNNFRHVTTACNKLAIDYELPNMSGANTGRIFLTLKIFNANNILVEERTQNLQNAGTGYQTYTFSDLPLYNGFRAEIEAKFYMYNATVPYKTMNATSTPPISNVTITNAPNIVTVNFRKDGCKKVCVDYNFPCATNLNKVIPKFKLMVYDHKNQIMVEREVYGTVMTNSSTYTYCFDRITLVNGGRVELSVDYYVYYHMNSMFLIKSETLSPINIENCYNTCFIDDGIYSSSKYGFNRTLPVIVAGNARYHEIDFTSFEDNNAQNLELHDGIIPKFPCTTCGSSQLIVGSVNSTVGEAHTGKHMIQATSTQGLVYKIYAKPAAEMLPGSEWTGAVVKVNAKHVYPQYNFLANKTYKLSFWVKGVSANDANGLVTVKCSHPITGKITNYTEASFTSPIIEKWRLCEMLIPLDEIDFSEMEIKIKDASQTIYIDDIRLVPDDADAKSFVYDFKSLRLISELDENHFATFYDYDDAGNLIRIRKETEKGIITLKEASFNYQNRK